MRGNGATPDDDRAARRHWRVSLAATFAVLSLSALVSFVPPLMALRRHPAFLDVTVGGTPWPYFIGAQGAVLAFVALVVGYTIAMSIADRRYRDALRDGAAEGSGTAVDAVRDVIDAAVAAGAEPIDTASHGPERGRRR